MTNWKEYYPIPIMVTQTLICDSIYSEYIGLYNKLNKMENS